MQPTEYLEYPQVVLFRASSLRLLLPQEPVNLTRTKRARAIDHQPDRRWLAVAGSPNLDSCHGERRDNLL
jgi:hypothetical protein